MFFEVVDVPNFPVKRGISFQMDSCILYVSSHNTFSPAKGWTPTKIPKVEFWEFLFQTTIPKPSFSGSSGCCWFRELATHQTHRNHMHVLHSQVVGLIRSTIKMHHIFRRRCQTRDNIWYTYIIYTCCHIVNRLYFQNDSTWCYIIQLTNSRFWYRFFESGNL